MQLQWSGMRLKGVSDIGERSNLKKNEEYQRWYSGGEITEKLRYQQTFFVADKKIFLVYKLGEVCLLYTRYFSKQAPPIPCIFRCHQFQHSLQTDCLQSVPKLHPSSSASLSTPQEAGRQQNLRSSCPCGHSPSHRVTVGSDKLSSVPVTSLTWAN